MGLYEVEAKCGHVGRDCYVIKTFAVIAESGKQAAELVRWMPRVKHHHKDAIRSVNMIDEQRYCEICITNSLDPYFHCKCIQEQRATCELELLYEVSEKTNTVNSCRPVYCGKKQLRNPKKYMNRYNDNREAA